MKASILVVLALPATLAGQTSMPRTGVSAGEVSRVVPTVEPSRLAKRIPGVDADLRSRLRITGDSAQRIAMNDFEWKGRVASVEIDEQDTRVFWDVKIVPDSGRQTIVRYRVDASSGGILDIREFTGVRGLARRP